MNIADEVHHEATLMIEQLGPICLNDECFTEELTRRVLQRLPDCPPAATRRLAIREWRELTFLLKVWSKRTHLLKM